MGSARPQEHIAFAWLYNRRRVVLSFAYHGVDGQ